MPVKGSGGRPRPGARIEYLGRARQRRSGGEAPRALFYAAIALVLTAAGLAVSW